MPCPALSRRALRSLCAVAVCLALCVALLPAVAQAATPTWTVLRTNARKVTLGDAVYKVRFTINQFGPEQDMTVSVKRVVDPDGAGLLRSVQTSAWWFVGVNALSMAGDRRSATVDTEDKLAPHGDLSYAFTATEPAQISCKGGRRSATGKLVGGMSLNTGTPLGVIHVGNLRGTLTTFVDPACSFPFGRGPERCPRRGNVIVGSTRGGAYLTAWHRTGAPHVKIRAEAFKLLTTDDPEVYAQRTQTMKSRVPGSGLRLRDDLGSGVLRGVPGSFARGRAVFTGVGRAVTESQRCGSGDERRKITVTFRRGQLAGTFLIDFLAGRDISVAEQNVMTMAANLAVRRI